MSVATEVAGTWPHPRGVCPPQTGKKSKLAMIAAAAANLPAATALCREPSNPTCWTQEDFESAVRQFFPDDWIGDDFPFMEDLINSDTLSMWRRWEEVHIVNSFTSAPARAQGADSAALGIQRGAVASRFQCAPILGWGRDYEAAFEFCKNQVDAGLTPGNRD